MKIEAENDPNSRRSDEEARDREFRKGASKKKLNPKPFFERDSCVLYVEKIPQS